MTLGRKLALQFAAQLIGVAIICAVGLWGLSSLRSALEQTSDQFGAARAVHRAGHHLAMARMLAQTDPPDLDEAHRQIGSALAVMDEFASLTRDDDRPQIVLNGQALLDAIRQATLDSDPKRLAAHATSGIAAVQQISQFIQHDVRSRRQASIALNQRATINLSVAGALIVLMSALIGFCQRRSVLRPLASLRRGVDRLRRSDFTGAVDRVGDREFRALAERFNEMGRELRKAQETLEDRVRTRTTQLIRSERLARLGVLAGGFAHEIKNPLAIISAHAELALRHWNDQPDPTRRAEASAEMAEALMITLDEVNRSTRVIDRLQSLGAHDQFTRRPVPLHDVLTTALELIEPIAIRAGCRIQRRFCCDPDEARTFGDENECVQLIINLLLNAIDATDYNAGVITVACLRDDAGVSIRITDNGRGIEPGRLTSVFDPFVSGTGGAGLGLAVCQAIAERHGARIAASSDGQGAGSVFAVTFPCHNVEVAA